MEVVVKLSENAFDTLHIYFPNTFIDKEGFVKELESEITGMNISLMDKDGVSSE